MEEEKAKSEELKEQNDDNIIIIKKKKRRFFKKIRGYKRFLLFFGIWTFIFLLVLAVSAELTSRPSFCPTCHYMEPFYQSWKSSSHNSIQCIECHFEPGLEGKIKGKLNGLVQIVSYISSSYKKRKPWADIPDNTCSRSGCHEQQAIQDTVYETKGILFNHKHHLGELRRGKKLKCTSCHSQIVQGSHMEVTYASCFTCHFKKSDDPGHKFDSLSTCTKCHNLESKTKEQLAAMKYNHISVTENKIPCSSCHTNVISGNGEVGKDRCFQCHFEDNKLDKYEDTEFMHKTHIAKHSMACSYCHTPIKHKTQKMEANSSPDCQTCHENSHTSQLNLYAGENGFNVEKSPSSMYLSGINCKGCHAMHEVSKNEIGTLKAKQDACDKCHGKGYGNLVKQWEQSTEKRVATVKSIYTKAYNIVNTSASEKKPDALVKLSQSEHNIKLVSIGKGVHNLQFSDKLLVGGYDLMLQALKDIGSSATLPEFKASTEFVPNECYNCHGGVQEISKKVFGKTFSHKTHVEKNRVLCNKCHSNSSKHGELIISESGCNSCHHSNTKSSETCAKCHEFQSKVFNGNFAEMNEPDLMKGAGVVCNDCHLNGEKIYKPDEKICQKCHDAGYNDMMKDWKKEISQGITETNNLIGELKGQDRSEEVQKEIIGMKKIVAQIIAYPSIYVHNYMLLSNWFSKNIKKLKSYK